VLISVIIPTLNEADNIERTITSARKNPGDVKIEVIVVDGGSLDNTIEVAQNAGARVVSAPAGRGTQLNEGVKRASGEIIIALHADTTLPTGFGDMVTCALNIEDVSGGAFTLSIDGASWRFRVVELLTSVRVALFGIIYGDQAIFTTKATNDQIGGFKNLPLFEELDYVMKLREVGRITVLPQKVVTSARRWTGSSIVKNTLRNWSFHCLYRLGVNPLSLYRRYYRDRFSN
jgi:rSAM/selenodomain-associated transferase 2